jgi:hypothetical protein
MLAYPTPMRFQMRDWCEKRDRMLVEIGSQLELGLTDPDKGLNLDQLTAFVEHRNPFEPEPAVPVAASSIVVPTPPQILVVDRSKRFDPATFVAPNWSIWKGPADGNGLEGEEDQDQRSLALSQIDLAKVRFDTTLRDGEPSVLGEERLRRLKAMPDIRLDALVFQTFYENPDRIPDSWKRDETGNIRHIYFDGTVLRTPDGYRCVPCLYFFGGRWDWGYFFWLEQRWDALRHSVLLAS